MNLLAIDSAGAACSACVCRDGRIVASAYTDGVLDHSRTLLCKIRDALKQSCLKTDELDKIALTTGPGSFTGIKIGIATAKGLAFKNNIPCSAVSSLEALADGVKLFEGTIFAVMDARRGQLYNAVFEASAGILRRLTPDRQIKADELTAQIKGKALAVGDGAAILARKCAENGLDIMLAPPRLSMIHAESVAQLALGGAGTDTEPDKLTASYLRLPQAERQRLGLSD